MEPKVHRLTTLVFPDPTKSGFVCYYCDLFIPCRNEGFINLYEDVIVHPLHCNNCNAELLKGFD